MARKYFGTDGIRGRANGLITPELALKVGQAAGLAFQRGDHRHRVVIGKDTRLSGYMIETALVAGFTSVGMYNCCAHSMWCNMPQKQCGTHSFGAPYNNYGPYGDNAWWPVYTCNP